MDSNFRRSVIGHHWLILVAISLATLTSCRSAAQHRLQATIDSFNSTCPFRMTEDIWIDSLHYDRVGQDVIYCCTYAGLPYVDRSNADMMETLESYTALESQRSFKSMNSNPSGKETLQLIRQAGAKLVFAYRLSDGSELTRHPFEIEKATFDVE